MKRYILTAFLVLLPVLAFAAFQWNGASVTVWNGASVSAWNGATAGGGATGQWYYSGDGTDNFTTMNSTTNAYFHGAAITGLSGKTATKIGYKQGTVNAATECTVALYDDATPRNLVEYKTVSTLADGWIEADLNASYSITGTVHILYECNGDSYDYKNTSYNGWWGSIAYSSFPASTQSTNTDTNNGFAVKIYAQ